MLLIILRLKGGSFLFLGGRSPPISWLFYTACVGAHVPAVELDNAIWFGTLSRVSVFLWHGSKWALRFVCFLQYTLGLEVVACRIYNDFNYGITVGLNMFSSQQVFARSMTRKALSCSARKTHCDKNLLRHFRRGSYAPS